MNMMTELQDVRHGATLHAKMRIAGELVGGARTIDVRNPWNGSVVGTVPKATVEDIRRAFAIAKAYKPTLTRHDRYRILYRAAEIIRSRSDAISDLITAECGICKKDSLYEVGRACDVFVFAGNAALNDDGQIFSCDLTPHGKKRKVYTLREPLLGAIAAITPFNHPLNQVAHKVAPSIATNNRMVLKPTEKTPLTALLLADILYEAGLPPADVLGRHRRSARNRRRDAHERRHGPRSRSPAGFPSASTSRRKRSTSGRCSSSAATTRSSSWRTPTSRKRPPWRQRGRTRIPASAAPRSSGCWSTRRLPTASSSCCSHSRGSGPTATRWIRTSTWGR